MPDNEYQSVERVLLLLRYLTKSENGVTRSDICREVPAYQQAITESAQRRMFERDIRQLEQVGYSVIRTKKDVDIRNPKRGSRNTIYRVEGGS